MGNGLNAISILLVEDNPDDVEITRRALEKGRVRNELTVARDGQEALDILSAAKNGETPCPGLILLDLNLPKVDGHEVLEKIKADPKLKRIPVVVLTVVTREEDVVRSYDLGVNTYITKPVRFEDFIKTVTTIEEYWTVIATLPPASGECGRLRADARQRPVRARPFRPEGAPWPFSTGPPAPPGAYRPGCGPAPAPGPPYR
jgi:two-component system response regulator